MFNFKQMDTGSLIKWVILAILAAFSCYVTFPAKEKVRLGLDLKGGSSFTVQIDQERLVEDLKAEAYVLASLDPAQASPEVAAKIDAQAQAKAQEMLNDEMDDLTLEVLRKRIDAIGTNEPIIAKGDNHRIFIQIPGADAAQTAEAEKSVRSAAFLTFRLVAKANSMWVDEVMASEKTPIGFERSSYRDRNGSVRPCFVRAANYAELAEQPDFAAKLGRFFPKSTIANECVMEELDETDVLGKKAYLPMFLSRSRETMLDGSMVVKARSARDQQTGRIVVELEFNDEGAKKFRSLTTKHVRERFAIVLDGVIRSAPVINEPIPNGRCQISGNFKWREAEVLSGVLNAGALRAPIRVIETRTVSPSLGSEAISKGTLSAAVGVVAVFVFMLVYYMLCGVVADVALLLNIILWPAGMIIASGIMSAFVNDGTGSSSLGQLPVLTLPGIAGLVLSVGMAVDANVLIFERMREEFRLGKTAKGAVAAGYERAFLAIFDSNLTTLITGVILFIFGSGPIRGFAVTLCGGIIISMFTALVITRLIFNLTVTDATKPFKMLQWVPETLDFDFLKWAKPVAIGAGAVIVLTLSIFFTRAFHNPASVMAVDFTGGLALTYEAVDKADGTTVVALDVEKVRQVVSQTGVTDQTVQSMTGENQKSQMLVKTSTVELKRDEAMVDTAKVIEQALDEAFPEQTVKLVSKDSVGSQIGSELKKDAFWAVVISLICIIAYVSYRFQFGFALGGVVALAHDAAITLGIFSICGNQLSLTTVAALLTIVGYSINDTIVTFDRIRELMNRDSKTDFPVLVRKALNQTLSRSLLTTVSTLLPVAALYFFGGAAMHDFAFALFIGMIAGTYSTLFIAPLVMLVWYRGKRPQRPVEKPEEAPVEA